MADLPAVSGAKAVRSFETAGWRKDRQRGSHVVMLKSGRNVSLSIPHNTASLHPVRCGR